MRQSPVVCEKCGRRGPGTPVEMVRVGRNFDGEAVWHAYECPECRAKGAVEEPAGRSVRQYHGAATTEETLIERDLSALTRVGGGGGGEKGYTSRRLGFPPSGEGSSDKSGVATGSEARISTPPPGTGGEAGGGRE